ncbi:MAG: hypothetical protein AB7R90_10400 [Reyranellaceae bacterium]
MRLLLASFAASFAAIAAAQAADKYVWDGYGTGSYSNCFVYGMHIEFTVENGRAVGWWQQKDRVVRNFDLPLGSDGSFTGKVNLGPADMNIKGNVGSSPEIRLTGYCNFGGPLKKL